MLAKTPPMGWNSWNTFGSQINEDLIMGIADVFIEKGLKDAGYEYIVIDDCWSEQERDPKTHKIIPDKSKFPHGMKYVSDYIHSKGLKFGMYSCAGVRTCGDFPGSFDNEFLDAQTFAEYGCDFLKYDYCYVPPTADGNMLYYRMGLALKACGREILFSACNWGFNDVGRWIRSTGAHMYRSTGDINDSFKSFTDIAISQKDNLCYSAPGCFNDIDMLTVGMFGKGNVASAGCDETDYKMQFSIWCLYNAPLILGNDIRSMDDDTRKLLTNKNLIRINQDPESRVPAVRYYNGDKNKMFIFKHLSDNEFALGVFNLADTDSTVAVSFYDVGMPYSSGYSFELTDADTGENLGVFEERISTKLKRHGSKVYFAKFVKR